MSDKKIFTYSLTMCLIFLIMGCEGDSYCMGPDYCSESYSYNSDRKSYPYIIECESNEVPIAIIDYGRDGIYGVIGGLAVNSYEYKQFFSSFEFGGYSSYDNYYGIFCLEKGINTYSLYSNDTDNDYDIVFLILDINNDGKYSPPNQDISDDDESIHSIYCNGTYADKCEEPFTGSFTLE